MEHKYFMIIDDDEDDRYFFKDVIKKMHSTVECLEAAGCEEGMALLKTATKLPHFIFLDINMPRVDGRECLKQLKKDASLKHIPVIMYSTSFSKETIKEFQILGASNYLIKPTDLTNLSSQLREVVKNL